MHAQRASLLWQMIRAAFGRILNNRKKVTRENLVRQITGRNGLVKAINFHTFKGKWTAAFKRPFSCEYALKKKTQRARGHLSLSFLKPNLSARHIKESNNLLVGRLAARRRRLLFAPPGGPIILPA